MSAKTVYVAENLHGLTIEDLQKDSVTDQFPGGNGTFVIDPPSDADLLGTYYDLNDGDCGVCSVRIVNDLVIVYFGHRLIANFAHFLKPMFDYLQQKCGGKVGVWSEQDTEILIESNPDSQTINTQFEEWPQLPFDVN